MFKEAYSNWSICYCAPLGLGSRPFIAPGDTRPASTMPGDDYSKQFRRELFFSVSNYHNATIYLCSDPMVPVHLQN